MLNKALIAAAITTITATSASAMEINFCTGKANDPYNVAGMEIAKFQTDNAKISVIPDTGGTWANIERTVLTPIDDPEACHAMIGQPDGKSHLERTEASAAENLRKVGEIHPEYMHALCSEKSGVDELTDLEEDPKAYSIALGDVGSGSWLFWQNATFYDDDYAEVPVKPEGGALAISGVASGETTCMLVPAGLGNQTVRDADVQFGDQLVLAEVDDSDFNDAEDSEGNDLYLWETIPSKTYPNNLQSGSFSGVDTLMWYAGVYIRVDAFQGEEKALNDFVTAVARARPNILAKFE